jgi:outer membrane receptor protein involved in Fe transport
LAIYGEMAFELNPQWTTTIGARLFEFREQLSSVLDGAFFEGTIARNRSLEQDGATTKFGVTYLPNEDTLLFFNAAEGFRPGGTNNVFAADRLDTCRDDLDALGIVRPPAEFESDSLWSYELGARTDWLDGRLAANVSTYQIDWHGMQTAIDLPCGITFVENAGRARNRGVELEAAWRAADRAELAANAAYIDARLTQDMPNVSGERGEHIPTVPHWTLGVSVDFQFSATARIDGFTRMDYRYIDSSWSSFDQTFRQRLPARHLLGWRVGLLLDDWEVELFVENALDDRGVLQSGIDDSTGIHETLIQPQTIGVRASYSLSPIPP